MRAGLQFRDVVRESAGNGGKVRYFISGITGTLGRAVSHLLLQEDHAEVVGFSRDECKQASFPPHSRLTLYLGDIRDRQRLIEATRDIDIAFHFAALKHVDQLEDNPEESVATNILGTSNVLHAQRVNHIPRVVLTSTDKAAYPVNVYGMSKGIAERMTLRNPDNIVCRYGNVLASRGSFIETLVKKLRQGVSVPVTDSNMTRFWITPDEASKFVIASAKRAGGGLCIPSMKGASITLIIEVVSGLLNVNSYHTENIGMRRGEKLHECLRTSYEGEETHSHLVAPYSHQELKELLAPIVKAIV